MADECEEIVTNSTELSKKNSKPIMEKRRRARINASLCELKSLLLDAMKKDGERHNKMEKADILEYTVRHIRQIQRQQINQAANLDPSILDKFYAGYNECTNEISRYLSAIDSIDIELRSKILEHLSNSMANSNTTTILLPSKIQQNHNRISIAPKKDVNNPNNNNNNNSNNDENGNIINNQQQHQQQVQVIPTKLSNGQIAFVLPNTEQTTANYVMITRNNTNSSISSNHLLMLPTNKQQTFFMQLPVFGDCSQEEDNNNNKIIVKSKTAMKRRSSSPTSTSSSSKSDSPSPRKTLKVRDGGGVQSKCDMEQLRTKPIINNIIPIQDGEPWRPW